MLYAILCYKSEDAVCAWTKDEDDAVMGRLAVVHQKWEAKTRFGPSLRLMPTTAATTLRKDSEPPIVIDGPFAETKEQLLGFYLMEAAGLEEVLDCCRDLADANPGGAYEVRPVFFYSQGNGDPASALP